MSPKIVLMAHGAGDGSVINRQLESIRHALETRFEGEVTLAFVRGTPTLEQLMSDPPNHAASHDSGPSANQSVSQSADGAPLLVIPLLLAEGYYARRHLPDTVRSLALSTTLGDPLDRARSEPASITIAPALAASLTVYRALIEELQETLRGGVPTARGAAILLVGHGTRRDPRSGTTLDAFADHLTTALAASPEHSEVTVHKAFLDQAPSVAEQLAEIETDRYLVVLPFLWGGASHADEDIPSLLERSADVHRETLHLPAVGQREPDWWATRALEQVDQVVARLPLRIGARRSALARRQAELLRQRLLAAGVPTELVWIEAAGDRDRKGSSERVGVGAFSRDLELALCSGEIDLAAHSLAHLPSAAVPPSKSPGDGPECPLTLASIPVRGTVGEVIVTRRGVPLEELPLNARVGTCSTRQASQLLRLAPHVEIMHLEGSVDQEVARVLSGELHGAVLAEAGLLRLGLDHLVAERFAPEDLLPGPGQGAVALQARSNDALVIAFARRIHHPATARSVAIELALADRSGDRQCAVLARALRPEVAPDSAGGAIRFAVQARWCDLKFDETLPYAQATGSDEGELIEEILRQLRAAAEGHLGSVA